MTFIAEESRLLANEDKLTCRLLENTVVSLRKNVENTDQFQLADTIRYDSEGIRKRPQAMITEQEQDSRNVDKRYLGWTTFGFIVEELVSGPQ